MSVLLMKVSGVTLLEQDIVERRPEYAEYARRTNAFFPAGRERPAPEAQDLNAGRAAAGATASKPEARRNRRPSLNAGPKNDNLH